MQLVLCSADFSHVSCWQGPHPFDENEVEDHETRKGRIHAGEMLLMMANGVPRLDLEFNMTVCLIAL